MKRILVIALSMLGAFSPDLYNYLHLGNCDSLTWTSAHCGLIAAGVILLIKNPKGQLK